MEAWDFARWNFDNRFPQKISCLGPATAESEGHIVSFDS
jgi:hypothetical protein